ncbi:hypothetical protein MHL31_09015 [Lutibacter sp. A80]|uniref:hypothetical protein n=1 Tax=Lutibacter sp. A80 TaxID=2918453 RepID=UPI001F05F50E|nr:hypothetical protein [Lutibacter sp. A80]UMB59220.1 hypothetical protein MHL31_09015 [Lutibacter sp. A80]
MKYVFILILFLFSIFSFSQQLEVDELVEIFKTNYSKVEPLLINNGFDFKGEDNSKYPLHEITFSTNSKYISEVETIVFIYSKNDLSLTKNKVIYMFKGKQKHNNLVKHLISSDFEYLDSLNSEDMLVKYYTRKTDNPKIYISASIFIVQDYFYSLIFEFTIIE